MQFFSICSGPWKIALKWPPMGPGGFFPINPDLADILGDTDFDFDYFYFLFLDFPGPKFPDFQVPRFPDSQTEAWAKPGGLGPAGALSAAPPRHLRGTSGPQSW